jgi:hypothetical protein
MNTSHIYRRTVYSLLLTACLGFAWITSCTKDNNVEDGIVKTSGTGADEVAATSGTATGSQQVPPVNTSARAMLGGTYNVTTNKWEYVIEWSGLSSDATAIEVRGPADYGMEGPLLAAASLSGVSGTQGSKSNMVTLSGTQEDVLLSKKYYYTVVNAQYPKGEIRGQILINAR